MSIIDKARRILGIEKATPFPWNSEQKMRRWLATTSGSSVWRMKTGEYTTFSRMTTRHLLNSVRMVERQARNSLARSLNTLAVMHHVRGDMAQYTLEQACYENDDETLRLWNIANRLQKEIDRRRTG